MAVYLDVIWFPDPAEILLGSGGADTWLRIGILVGLVVGITVGILRKRRKNQEESK